MNLLRNTPYCGRLLTTGMTRLVPQDQNIESDPDYYVVILDMTWNGKEQEFMAWMNMNADKPATARYEIVALSPVENNSERQHLKIGALDQEAMFPQVNHALTEIIQGTACCRMVIHDLRLDEPRPLRKAA